MLHALVNLLPALFPCTLVRALFGGDLLLAGKRSMPLLHIGAVAHALNGVLGGGFTAHLLKMQDHIRRVF